MNSGDFHHRAHRTPGNNSRAIRRGLEHHMAGTVVPVHLMRNGCALQIQLQQTLFRLLDGFANGHRNFLGFSGSKSGVALLIADDDERGEAQVFAALHDLRDAVNGNNLILQGIRAEFHVLTDGELYLLGSVLTFD